MGGAEALRFDFASPGRIGFGPGVIGTLAKEASALGSRALLVTGRDPWRHRSVLEALHTNGLTADVAFAVDRDQRVRKAVNPPGEAKDDLWIISEVSKRLGYDMQAEPEKVFDEYRTLWAAMSGISYARLEKHGLNWPCPTPVHPGTPFLYKDGFPKGRVPFIPVAYQPPAEVCDDAYPFVLTTGRNLFQYHSGSMTRRVEPIEAHAGEPYVEINPYDRRTWASDTEIP